MLRKLVIALLLVEIADGLMCYQCADSSSEDGRNRCQTYVRTMRYYRKRFYENKLVTRYVKNCTGFNDLPTDQVVCAVTTVANRGGFKSFIRDCSDGLNFFESDNNYKFQPAIPDNQTTCHYDGQGYVACVTICNTDFCNGPSDASNIKPMHLLILFCAVILVLQNCSFFTL